MNHRPVATRGPGLHLVPSQVTERHQAHDEPAVYWQPNEPLAWRRALPILALFAVVSGGWFATAAGDWLVALPDGAKRQLIVALVLTPTVAAVAVWAWRRLR